VWGHQQYINPSWQQHLCDFTQHKSIRIHNLETLRGEKQCTRFFLNAKRTQLVEEYENDQRFRCEHSRRVHRRFLKVYANKYTCISFLKKKLTLYVYSRKTIQIDKKHRSARTVQLSLYTYWLWRVKYRLYLKSQRKTDFKFIVVEQNKRTTNKK